MARIGPSRTHAVSSAPPSRLWLPEPSRRPRHIVALQQLAQHIPQLHRPHWLVQQQVPAVLRFAQPLGGSVAADQEGRNRGSERRAQFLDRLNARVSAALYQTWRMTIGKDERQH